MRLSTITRLFLCVLLLTQSTTFAFETDQYNLPPKPLADIGDEVSQYVEQNLRKAVEKINTEIIVRQSCLENNFDNAKKKDCDSPDKERAELRFLRSEDAIAREVYNLLGTGIPPFTKSGSWMESHKFNAEPSRYKTSYQNSIFFVFPTNYLTISSTINLYGAQFGTDKIAHIFQQGYSYYRIYNHAISQGLTPEQAAEKAVRWGRKTEQTFYGTLISGVYSNADLCANYVGMKFYQGLTREIKIGKNTRPAILLIKNGIWTFNEDTNLREVLLKPFISDHLNEALNPSKFAVGLRYFVRRNVRKRSCRQWFNRYPNLNRAELDKTSQSLKLWNGEDYGFSESNNFITISNTCFDGEARIDKYSD